MSIKIAIENFFRTLVTDIDTVIEPGIKYLEQNVPAVVITLAESVLSAAIAGTPWSALIAELVTQAEAQGIKLVENAGTVALNTAENNLIAKGTPAPVTVAAQTPSVN